MSEINVLASRSGEHTAFVVCDALGIDSGAYSFAYVANWSTDPDYGIDRTKAHAERIQKTASTILATLGVEAGTGSRTSYAGVGNPSSS